MTNITMGRLALSCANHEMTHLDIILAMRMGKKFVCLDGEGICAIQVSINALKTDQFLYNCAIKKL